MKFEFGKEADEIYCEIIRVLLGGDVPLEISLGVVTASLAETAVAVGLPLKFIETMLQEAYEHWENEKIKILMGGEDKMDKQIKKIQKHNKAEGKELKTLLKMDKKRDAEYEKYEKHEKLEKKMKKK